MTIAQETSVQFVTTPVGAHPGGPHTVLHAVTSRSEIVRLAPVVASLASLGVKQALTRPTFDRGATPQILNTAGVPHTETLVDPSTDSPSERTARTLAAFEAMLVKERPATLVIGGDGDATLACALAASKLGIPIVRVGGGLRSYDWALSDEINRVLTDRLADLLLVDSTSAADALESEGIAAARVHFVGNTVVDSVARWQDEARRIAAAGRHGLADSSYVLATLHRAENVEVDWRLSHITEELIRLAERYPVVFPMHPRTAAVMTATGDVKRLQTAGVRVTGPLEYLDFLSMQATAGAILTDSGCVQEEASALGVRCYTMRRVTERGMTLTHGTNVLLGDDPREIANVDLDGGSLMPTAIPYWDGRAAGRAAAALEGAFAVAA